MLMLVHYVISRVVTLSERRSDWNTIIIQLKRYFGQYLRTVNVALQEGNNNHCLGALYLT